MNNDVKAVNELAGKHVKKFYELMDSVVEKEKRVHELEDEIKNIKQEKSDFEVGVNAKNASDETYVSPLEESEDKKKASEFDTRIAEKESELESTKVETVQAAVGSKGIAMMNPDVVDMMTKMAIALKANLDLAESLHKIDTQNLEYIDRKEKLEENLQQIEATASCIKTNEGIIENLRENYSLGNYGTPEFDIANVKFNMEDIMKENESTRAVLEKNVLSDEEVEKKTETEVNEEAKETVNEISTDNTNTVEPDSINAAPNKPVETPTVNMATPQIGTLYTPIKIQQRERQIREEMKQLLGDAYEGKLEDIEKADEHAISYQMDDWAIDRFQELRDELKRLAKEENIEFDKLDREDQIRFRMGQILNIDPFIGIENENEFAIHYQLDDNEIDEFQELREELRKLEAEKNKSAESVPTPTVTPTVTPVVPTSTPEVPTPTVTSVVPTSTPEVPTPIVTPVPTVTPSNENVVNDNNKKLNEQLMAINNRCISSRKVKFHKFEKIGTAVAVVAACGLGLTNPLTLGAAAITAGIAGVDIVADGIDAAEKWATKHKLKKIAREFNKKYRADLGNEKLKLVYDYQTKQLQYKLGENILSSETSDHEKVEFINYQLNEEFRKQNSGLGDYQQIHLDDGSYKDYPKVDIDNLEAAFVKFGGYKTRGESDDFGEFLPRLSSKINDLKEKFFNGDELSDEESDELLETRNADSSFIEASANALEEGNASDVAAVDDLDVNSMGESNEIPELPDLSVQQAPVQVEQHVPVQEEQQAPVQEEQQAPVQEEQQAPVQEEQTPVQEEQQTPVQEVSSVDQMMSELNSSIGNENISNNASTSDLKTLIESSASNMSDDEYRIYIQNLIVENPGLENEINAIVDSIQQQSNDQGLGL